MKKIQPRFMILRTKETNKSKKRRISIQAYNRSILFEDIHALLSESRYHCYLDNEKTFMCQPFHTALLLETFG